MYGGPQQPDFVQSIQTLTGITHSSDLNGGSPNCVAYTPNVGIIVISRAFTKFISRASIGTIVTTDPPLLPLI